MKKEESIKIDPIWQKSGYNNIEEILKMIVLRKEIPENVVNRYELIYKLIEFSKFEYEFLDIAFERALSTFELALRNKYSEINIENEDAPFIEIIKWANENNLTYYEEQQLNSIRKLRNSLVGHPKGKTVMPPSKIESIYFLTELINSIYNDSTKNAHIKKSYHNAYSKLNELVESSIMLIKDDMPIPIGEGYMIYYDYKNEIYIYLFVPIFYIDPLSKEQALPGYIPVLSKDIIEKEGEYNEINGESFQIKYADSTEKDIFTDYRNNITQVPYLRECIMEKTYHDKMKMIIEINRIVNQENQ